MSHGPVYSGPLMKRLLVVLFLSAFISEYATATCILPYAQILTTIGAHQEANVTSLKTDTFLAGILATLGLASVARHKKVTVAAKANFAATAAVAVLGLTHAARYSIFKSAEKEYDIIGKVLGRARDQETYVEIGKWAIELGLKPDSQTINDLQEFIIDGITDNSFCPDGIPLGRTQISQLFKSKNKI